MELLYLIGGSFWCLLAVSRGVEAHEKEITRKRAVLLMVRDTVLMGLGIAFIIGVSKRF